MVAAQFLKLSGLSDQTLGKVRKLNYFYYDYDKIIMMADQCANRIATDEYWWTKSQITFCDFVLLLSRQVLWESGKKLVLRMHVAATAIRYWDNCTCCQSTTLFPDIEDGPCYFHYWKVSWLTSGLGVVWPRWPRLPRQDRSVRRLQTRCSQPELQRIVPWVSPRRKVNLTKHSGLLKIFNFKFQPRAKLRCCHSSWCRSGWSATRNSRPKVKETFI